MDDALLEQFWVDYIGDSEYVYSDAITQVFCRGPFAGHSIREIMEAAIIRLKKVRPAIRVNEYTELG